MIPRRSLLLGGLALAGCASLPRANAYPPAGPFPELEPIRLLGSNGEGLTLEIASRGCLATPDLAFHVERRNGVATIAFARRRLQTCKDQVGDWTEVAFSRDQLGLAADEPVFLLNPILPSKVR